MSLTSIVRWKIVCKLAIIVDKNAPFALSTFYLNMDEGGTISLKCKYQYRVFRYINLIFAPFTFRAAHRIIPVELFTFWEKHFDTISVIVAQIGMIWDRVSCSIDPIREVMRRIYSGDSVESFMCLHNVKPSYESICTRQDLELRSY